jgi:hypothetical protein
LTKFRPKTPLQAYLGLWEKRSKLSAPFLLKRPELLVCFAKKSLKGDSRSKKGLQDCWGPVILDD